MIVLRISLTIIAAVPQLPSWREEGGLFEPPAVNIVSYDNNYYPARMRKG